MVVALLARQSEFAAKLAATLPDARAYPCDVSNATSVSETFARIRNDLGDPMTVVYNAGSGVWGDVDASVLKHSRRHGV